jgi:hypothetical protein
METSTIVMAVAAGVALVLYLLRRRSRLSRED